MINEPKLLTIKKTFERADGDLVKRLCATTTCWIGDAMDGRGALNAAIRPIVPGKGRIAGTAITARTSANSNAAIFAAITIAKPGDVVIVDAEGFEGAAVVGDVLAGMARNQGIAALVIDGMVRDIEGLREVGLPIWARGLTPNSCSREGVGNVGFPINIGGQQIACGDIVVIDEDGIVPVPQEAAARVLAIIDEIKIAEAKILARVADGLTVSDPIAALLQSDRVNFVE